MDKKYIAGFILGALVLGAVLLAWDFIGLNKQVKQDTAVSSWVYTNIIQPNQQKSAAAQAPATPAK